MEKCQGRPAPGVAPPGRGERKRLATRKRLLAAARTVFAREGLANATVAQIAQEADLGFGTFYLHFTGKDDAYRAVVTDGFAELRERLRSAREQTRARGEPWWVLVRAAVAAYYTFAVEQRELFIVMFAGGDTGLGLGRELEHRFAAEVAGELVEAHASGPGSLHAPANPAGPYPYQSAPVGLAVVAALSRVILWWMSTEDDGDEVVGAAADTTTSSPRSLEELIETMSHFVVAALSGYDPSEQSRHIP